MSGEQRRGWPLRPTLLSVVVILILAGAGGVGLLAYLSSNAIVDHLWTGFADQIGAATTHRALRYFEPAPPYVELTRRQAKDGRLEVGPFDEEHPPKQLLDHFRAAIEANVEFTWASFGAEDGTYVAVHRDAEGAIRGVWRTVNAGGGTTLRELRPEGDAWEELERREGDYDPRVRPWYRAAAQADEGVWVEPFVFATIQQPGFMYARAHRIGDGLHGVFAVEYEMSDLSAFLSTLEVGKTGRVYVVTRDGEVVGHPLGETTTETEGELAVAHADDHPDAMLSTAWDALKARDHEPGHFQVGPYLAMNERFPVETGIDWDVLVVVPEDDFFGQVEAQALQTTIIAIVAALLAILFGAFFSNRVSGALRAIADELERIGRFELERGALEDEGKSFVREVNEMRDTTLRMKRSLRSFGKYVPKELVRELILSGEEAELGGRREELTVLFSDIAGFTSVAEKLTPDVLVEILGEYLDGMSQAVRDAGGTLDKFIGDAIMAFWGAPHAREDHALAACRGALKMRRELKRLQKGWDERGLPRLDTRIGVSTGDMLVGNIGAPERLNYTVMGDAVNLGARLEALNKEYGTAIMVADETARAAEVEFVFRPLDFVAVKGKAQAIRVWELVDEKDAVGDDVRSAIAVYREALDAYRARNFEQAAAGFDAAKDAFGGDRASERMAERCRRYAAEPPPDDWDGSYVMTTK